jgi:hypothetical protein
MEINKMLRNEDDFKKIVNRLEIDDKPNPAHRETLRRQIISVFNETNQSQQTEAPRTLSWQSIRRTFMKSTITKLAAAVVIIVVTISFFSWFSRQEGPSQGPDGFGGFTLLAKACAAEDAFFAGENIVHIESEIIVFPILQDDTLSDSPDSSNFTEQVKKDFEELNARPNFTWLPMCSLRANGQFQFNQLKLSAYIEPYTVTDEAWYDPATGFFARVLMTEGKVVFANSYDGEFVYTSQVAPDGTLELVRKAVTSEFRPPQRPAEFLGMGAGLRSSLGQDTPMVQGVEQGTMEDGCPVRIYKVGFPDTQGKLIAYWLFKVREDNATITEKEFIISDKTQLLIRRALTESVPSSEISWSLAEIRGLDVIIEGKPRVSVMPDMVIPDVSVQHMVEKAGFETYLFATNPPWTSDCEIVDCFDPLSPGYRMFCIAHRADDGRHIVLVQSHTYNKMLGNFAKAGEMVYSSPNGFKVWGGGPQKWYSQILLTSARSVIKDPPSEDRVGFVLESPAGTFPALAVNGPLSDEELHRLIDSLVPAKDYLE